MLNAVMLNVIMLNVVAPLIQPDSLFLWQDEPEGEGEHDAAVAGVAEHDREQEGEGGDGEHGGVHLPIGVHAVGINLGTML